MIGRGVCLRLRLHIRMLLLRLLFHIMNVIHIVSLRVLLCLRIVSEHVQDRRLCGKECKLMINTGLRFLLFYIVRHSTQILVNLFSERVRQHFFVDDFAEHSSQNVYAIRLRISFVAMVYLA